MPQPFAVIRTRGPAWDDARRMEDQPDWRAHAAFMDGLYASGFLLLAGPLEGTRDVLLIVHAESAADIEDQLAADPWVGNGLLELKQIARWTLRIGSPIPMCREA